ncbi:MAG: SMI1/KNR4 family protein [Rivularia sp. (in: cyanobacteria)]
MSELTQALNRIMTWLSENQPSFAASFLPGLTNEQIHAAVQHLPFELPEEIYELYRWRNGTQERHDCDFYPAMEFLTIEKAVKLYEDIATNDGTEEEIRFEGYKFFTFIVTDNDFTNILIGTKEKPLPVIYFYAEDCETEIAYSSLTNMMLTIAECYETGAYYLTEDGFVEQNEVKSAEIFRKYNPNILEDDN